MSIPSHAKNKEMNTTLTQLEGCEAILFAKYLVKNFRSSWVAEINETGWMDIRPPFKEYSTEAVYKIFKGEPAAALSGEGEKMAEGWEFKYFQNHGDDDGRGCFTICFSGKDEFGDDDFDDAVITGAVDTEEDAKEACNRLNKILRQQLEAGKAPESAPNDLKPGNKTPDWMEHFKPPFTHSYTSVLNADRNIVLMVRGCDHLSNKLSDLEVMSVAREEMAKTIADMLNKLAGKQNLKMK